MSGPTSAVLLSAALAAAAAGCLRAVPGPAGLRLRGVVTPAPARLPRSPTHTPTHAPAYALRDRPAAALGVVLVVALLVRVLGLVPALVVAAVLGAVARSRRARAAAELRREERERAVEACGALASELRAGRSPGDALEAAAELAAGPSRAALAAAAGAVRLGGDAAGALRPPEGTAVPDVLRALSACWAVCAGSGSGLAAAVERLEEGLRADQAQRRAVDAELAGPRATAALLAVLPAAGLLLAAGLGADPLGVLLTTPVGQACLVGGVLLDATGLWWTGRLVARAGGRN